MKSNKVQYFDHNVEGIDYVVGDLHGCLDELYQLMSHVGFDAKVDRMFSVGDLVDRGPKSRECAELIYKKWFHCIQGNHEQLAVEAIESNGSNTYLWYMNGGDWAIAEDMQWLEAIAEDFKRLPLVIVVGKNSDNRVNIVHAEMATDKDYNEATDEGIDDWSFNENNENNMVWGRGLASSTAHNAPTVGLSTTYVGHTPTKQPVEKASHRFIDTGAVFWYKNQYQEAKLTMARISDGKIYSLDMSTKYISEGRF